MTKAAAVSARPRDRSCYRSQKCLRLCCACRPAGHEEGGCSGTGANRCRGGHAQVRKVKGAARGAGAREEQGDAEKGRLQSPRWHTCVMPHRTLHAPVCVSVQVCVHACVCVQVYVRVCVHVCMSVPVWACVCVCTYRCL